MAALYNAFRFTFGSRLGGGDGFIALTEIKLMNDNSANGVQLLKGGTATSKTYFGPGYEASLAFDGVTSTRWASSGGTPPEWIVYTLPSAIVKPKYLYLMLNNQSESNGPAELLLEGSSDGGVTWNYLYSASNFATAAQLTSGIVLSTDAVGLRGYALDSSGLPANRVLIYNWNTGALVKSVTPKQDGTWVYIANPGETYKLMAVATNNVGARPQAHGPLSVGVITENA